MEIITGAMTALITPFKNGKVDLLFEEADYESCEMMIFPGGMPGATNLLNHRELMETMVRFAVSGKPVAAICAAPMIFGPDHFYYLGWQA